MSEGPGDFTADDFTSGMRDLISLSDGTLLSTHGPDACRSEACCIHSPSDHPLRSAPLRWMPKLYLMVRMCEHEVIHPDPDSMEYRTLLVLAGRLPFYDGWHPCCEQRCCIGYFDV